MLSKEEKIFLEEKAKKVRKLIIEMLYYAGSGHPGGSLSIVEILLYLRVRSG
ncbi:hypothetical protein AN618_17410 [Fervidicola ferrireducens]|uniref:Uncharacterized protein n=1 Tax=Fervidicola ferrireducens TaxID=520764 RepID=A0A140L5K6_9FIRM|nr:hypothetical protein [Fervidicola ferrireducens]KXG75831.1 hypothetical protein AN618_17410 [Fervidicola ferrireducens]